MEKLPTPEEQGWLLGALEGLITTRGSSHFIAMPILEPTREHFPDPWEPGFKGVDRVTRRLMQYAGCAQFDIDVGFFDSDRIDMESNDTGCRSVAGVFLGIEAGRCHFGLDLHQLKDEESTIGVMAHEVAHAYRAIHKIPPAETREEEELLTDVTAAYLGFGILVTNNSSRYRTQGGWGYHSWSTEQVGYLPPQAFAYLLGVQFVVRSTSQSKVPKLVKHLEPNQRDFVRAAMKQLRKSKMQLPNRLNLTPAELREPVVLPASIMQSLPEFVEPPVEEALESEAPAEDPYIVFRVRRSHATLYAGVLGSLGALFGALVFESFLLMTVLIALGSIIGARLGSRSTWYVCSGEDCESRLEADVTKCSQCGGIVVGTLRRRKDLWTAHEEYEDSVRGSS